jgi:hypothetical protein
MRVQPAGLADRTLFEILLMAHQFGARLRALNACAIEDDVNLAVTLELADELSEKSCAGSGARTPGSSRRRRS